MCIRDRNIIFLGPPGTGKGTQAEQIAGELKIAHVSTGEMFRQLAEEGDEVGVMAKEKYWGKGLLVPDAIVIKLVKTRLDKEDCKQGFILDGFPRTIEQAKALNRLTRIDKVFYISSSKDIILKRLTARRECPVCHKIYGLDVKPQNDNICDVCGVKLVQRDDDKEEVVKERLKVYEKLTKPLVDYYKKQNKLIIVDGDQAIDKVKKEILNNIQ